jgi:hypothetical protein
MLPHGRKSINQRSLPVYHARSALAASSSSLFTVHSPFCPAVDNAVTTPGRNLRGRSVIASDTMKNALRLSQELAAKSTNKCHHA